MDSPEDNQLFIESWGAMATPSSIGASENVNFGSSERVEVQYVSIT